MGRGYLRLVPAPLRPWVRVPLDALRRAWTRIRWLFGVRLHPRRIAATRRFLRQARRIHRLLPEPRDRLRVAVDADALWDDMTGIGWYLHRILVELAQRDDLELVLYGPPSYGDDRPPSVPLPENDALRVVRCPVPADQSLPLGLAFHLLRRLEPGMIAQSGCRALWLPNFLEPPRFRRLDVPRVVTVHDLASDLLPWTLRESRRRELQSGLRPQVGSAAHVLTPSEQVRAEMVQRGLVARDGVTAVLHGPGHLAGEPTESEGTGDPPQDRLGLEPGRFAIHVGTLEPRKNVEFLVARWREWRQSGSSSFVPLVLCGGPGWKQESLQRSIAEGCGEGWLVRPGYVDDRDLAWLYRNARFSASASLYEGFGLPLVESMAAETPVVCSDLPVYREVTAGAAVLVDLDEPDAWVRAFEDLASRDDLHEQLVGKARERTGELSWSRAAARVAEILVKSASATPGVRP